MPRHSLCVIDFCVAAELQAKRRIVKRVPKGTSEYQAAWIIDSEEEVWIVFTARRYASAVLAVIVCLFVRPSVAAILHDFN